MSQEKTLGWGGGAASCDGHEDLAALSSMRSNGDQATVPSEEDESGTSETCGVCIAPIPNEELEEVWHVVSDDDGSEDESNNPTLPDEDDSSDSMVEDDDRISKFEKEVEETFHQALGGGVNQDNLILEINGLRLAYSLQCADCVGAVFYSVMKSALVAAQCTDDALLVTTVEALNKWKYLLRNYTKTIDEEMEVLFKFGVMCQETTKDFSPLFSEILPYLYDMELVSGDAILRWEEEKEHADKSYEVFIKQSEAFIQWLKEPEVED